VSSEPALCIPDQFFSGEPAHALNEPAFDLTNIDCRVNAIAHIVKNIDAPNDIFTREGIDLDLTAGGAEREIKKRPAAEGLTVIVNLWCLVKTIAPELDPGRVGLSHELIKRHVWPAA